jgi:hypothetical protein
MDKMNKLPISYDNACIYKIVCKDVNITEKYVGSTTKLIKRQNNHAFSCKNENNKDHNTYVYQFIRSNGGFKNWDVVLVEKVVDCKDIQHLRKRERFYIESLKPELNTKIPMRTQKEYYINNKEKIKEYNKEYKKNNKKTIDEKNKEYAIKNKEIIAVKKKEYYKNNSEKSKEQAKEYQKKYREKHNEQVKAYYEKNKDKLKEQRISKSISCNEES